jgi:hypothetical protein
MINEKFLRKEVFKYFVEMLLGCCLYSFYEFFLNVHFEVQASWFAPIVVIGTK